ncbi:ImmA/IrrE family metallo-endopeptidase [Mollicutes bacterium LVI A0039]|nr:ImmA/IrrE family metallo-endopeptidase [Mollicutes bacterium LVI A0039]
MKKKLTKEDLDALIDSAVNENRANLVNYFRLSNTFTKYSPKNIEMINGQTGGLATICKSFSDWKSEGVYVNKGESAIRIFVPQTNKFVVDENGYVINNKSKLNELQLNKLSDGTYKEKEKITFKLAPVVFDIKQTNADETNYVESIQPKDNLHQSLLHVSRDLGIKVEYSTTNNDRTLGFAVQREEQIINLDANLSEQAMNSVFLHELAHHMLGHTLPTNKVSHHQKEFEAESVAALVGDNFGCCDEVSSNKYLQKHLEDGDFQIEDTIDKILDISSDLINSIEELEVDIDHDMYLEQ